MKRHQQALIGLSCIIALEGCSQQSNPDEYAVPRQAAMATIVRLLHFEAQPPKDEVKLLDCMRAPGSTIHYIVGNPVQVPANLQTAQTFGIARSTLADGTVRLASGITIEALGDNKYAVATSNNPQTAQMIDMAEDKHVVEHMSDQSGLGDSYLTFYASRLSIGSGPVQTTNSIEYSCGSPADTAIYPTGTI